MMSPEGVVRLMGGIAVVVRVFRELPQRVRHIAVRVLVHIGPAHTDHVQHRVDTLRNRVAHDATTPATDMNLTNKINQHVMERAHSPRPFVAVLTNVQY
ncbi:hypothetical protein [Streptomyces mutomycini]|uniref:hypothetical protein n=1 Tax=Streptomyces mutomycini TaxID=284036 RepID=UPI0034087AA7